MLPRLFRKNRRKDTRIPIKGLICVLNLTKYNPKTEEIDYGGCAPAELLNIGPNGISVKHDGSMKKGDMLEFRVKYSMEDKKCLLCPYFQNVSEELQVMPFIGKVIWRDDSVAGINIIVMRDKDRGYLKRLVTKKPVS